MFEYVYMRIYQVSTITVGYIIFDRSSPILKVNIFEDMTELNPKENSNFDPNLYLSSVH